MPTEPFELSCQQVQSIMAGEEPPALIDCREPQEHALGALPGATLLPMSELTSRVGELEPLRESPLIVYCHHGMRSAQVVAWLREQGFNHAQNMAGGIDQWSIEIDPSVPRY